MKRLDFCCRLLALALLPILFAACNTPNNTMERRKGSSISAEQIICSQGRKIYYSLYQFQNLSNVTVPKFIRSPASNIMVLFCEVQENQDTPKKYFVAHVEKASLSLTKFYLLNPANELFEEVPLR